MTMKELFKKVETYNEIADLMRTDKVQVVLTDTYRSFKMCAGTFKTYKEFTKFVKYEYQDEVAKKMIASKEWEIDGEITFPWGWDGENIATFGVELSVI